ncbi:MAG: Smr/MutS family protein [Candidatus Cloacimonetes bacterium]|nr:Smr/MutS family protein [Candidatus Cloacimonadota bacterium]
MTICSICGNEFDSGKSCPFCGSKPDNSKQLNKKQKYIVFNIKSDMPSADEANFRLKTKLQSFRKQGIRFVKIIHGYGSSGIGGELRFSLRESLKKMKKNRIIDFFVTGENFRSGDNECRTLTHLYPALLQDSDYNNNNKGITIIVLR